MARNEEVNRYFTIAVPKGSRLLQRIEDAEKNARIHPGQMVVYLASKYVILMESGSVPSEDLLTTQAVEDTTGVRTIHAEQASTSDLDQYGAPD